MNNTIGDRLTPRERVDAILTLVRRMEDDPVGREAEYITEINSQLYRLDGDLAAVERIWFPRPAGTTEQQDEETP